MNKKSKRSANAWQISIAALAIVFSGGAVQAQDASNGYRLYQFTNTIKGTAQNCASCHGENPRMPPNAMLANVNIGTACGQAWPAGTAHALKGLCNIGPTATQMDAVTRLTIGLAQPQMAQFVGLTTAERADVAAYLLAVNANQAVAFARPEYQQAGNASAITTLNFGSVNEGATASLVVYFVNGGTAPMTIGAGFMAGSAVSGLNAGRYTVTTAVPAGETACAASLALAAGARCGLTVTFSPDAAIPGGALQTAALTIPSNGGSGVSQLNLNGTRTIVAAPGVALTPAGTDLSAGPTPAGTSIAFSPVTLANNGTVALNISAITIGGTNAAEFTRATGGANCATATPINAAANCTLQFSFAPAAGATGTRTATVEIASNAPNSPLRLTLTGSVGTLQPTVSFGTTSNAGQAFLRLQAGQVGVAVSGVVTVRNIGAANAPALTVTNVELVSGAPSFSIAPGAQPCLNVPIAAGGSCTVNVSYMAPNMSVPHAGSLRITSNGRTAGAAGTDGPHEVLLEGTVIVAGSGQTTATSPDVRSLRFDNTPVNSLSRQQERITVINAGGSALTVQAQLANRQSDFAVVNGCTSVAVGSRCYVDVQFRPRSEGARSDTLTLTYNGGSLPPMQLSGTGQSTAAAGQGSGGGALDLRTLALLSVGTMLASLLRRRRTVTRPG